MQNFAPQQQVASRPAGVVFTDAALGYGRNPVLSSLCGAVEPGSLTAVLGPNGAGKSTLLKSIAGMLRPLAGSIATPGLSAVDIAYLPQQSELDRTFPVTVHELVALGLWPRRGPLGRVRAADRQDISEALQAVGLGGLERRGIDTLSGGQMQRALFARVILQDAALILLDEPFNSIDGETTGDLIRLVGRWRDQKRTVLAAMHDLELARAAFPQSLLLSDGAMSLGDTAAMLTPDTIPRVRSAGLELSEVSRRERRAA